VKPKPPKQAPAGERAIVVLKGAQAIMQKLFESAEINHRQFIMETRAIAHAAAEDGDYSAAARAMEVVGKAAGFFAPEVHMHVNAPRTEADLANLSDDALRALVHRAKPVEATVVADEHPLFR
jgi:hypothetical protein